MGIVHGLDRISPQGSLGDFIDFFYRQGNWRTLLATSLCWFFLDFAFCGIGMNSPSFIGHIWSNDRQNTTIIHPHIKKNFHRSFITLLFVSLLGAFILLKVLRYWARRKIRLWSFSITLVLFMVIGSLITWLNLRGSLVFVFVLYLLCLTVFNFGPNIVMTFTVRAFLIYPLAEVRKIFTDALQLPAEIFPTRYRASC
jgi:MFS transporter, PHS family, inorganic phosphate transporter